MVFTGSFQSLMLGVAELVPIGDEFAMPAGEQLSAFCKMVSAIHSAVQLLQEPNRLMAQRIDLSSAEEPTSLPRNALDSCSVANELSGSRNQ